MASIKKIVEAIDNEIINRNVDYLSLDQAYEFLMANNIVSAEENRKCILEIINSIFFGIHFFIIVGA